MGTVLLTWELGSGIGHLMNLRPIGLELVNRGHRVIAAVRDQSHVNDLFSEGGISFVPTPIVPRQSPLPFEQILGFVHILGNIGFSSQQFLQSAFASWNSIFDTVKPDLVVADHSPTALLALRGRPIRKVNVGLGFFCPPQVFPLPFWPPPAEKYQRERIIQDELAITTSVNRLLDSHLRPQVQYLSQIFTEIDEVFLATFPEFDHFGPRPHARYWGHRSRGGKAFTDSDIKRYLTDPTAKGTHRGNYTRLVAGKVELKPQKDWVITPVEPLISEELWARCYQLVDDRKLSPHPVAKKPVHLFAGVAYCVCGNKMYVPSNTPKYVCQKCRNKIPIVDLEGVFHEQLKHFFLSPEEIAKYLNEADKTLSHKHEVLDILIRERQKIGEAMDRIYDLYMRGEIGAEGFGARYKPLEDRSKQLDDEIPRLQAEVDLLKISYLSKDQMFSNARDLYGRWPDLPYDERRKIAESLTQKITVGHGEIDIDLCYLPSPNPSQNMVNEQ